MTYVSVCLKDVQEVYRGLTDAFEMKGTVAGPKTGNSEVECLGAAHCFHSENGLEINGDPKHAAIFAQRDWN